MDSEQSSTEETDGLQRQVNHTRHMRYWIRVNPRFRAFSELSSYHSGTSLASTEFSSGDTSSSDATDSSADEEESDDDFEKRILFSRNFSITKMRIFGETEETSESSPRSPHSSDTSFGLSTLIEETDREKLAEFVRLRPDDLRWISAAWSYFDNEPVHRRKAKSVKVVRKMRSNVKYRGNWTELQHEYNLRHPLCADGKTMEELKRISLDARYMPLPDLTV
ncbi:hypothetical protein ANCCAN_19583 [Ancylostoma caninum]|uniref:Uncharacterized protein n=1 Tax=Ancylostoma caninum TaxID=29170 RepID=A0A368FWB9_ANCCA|nr:hypothetical protein ANCCAN_19583 [Ancylostoma caninum]